MTVNLLNDGLSESDRALLNPAVVGWLGDELPVARSVLEAALKLVGARLDRADAEDCLALIGTFENLETASVSALETLRARMRDTPMLLSPREVGGALSDASLAALRMLARDDRLSFAEAATDSSYSFGDADMLRPFVGQVLRESVPRQIAPLVTSSAATPLVTNRRGTIFARYPTGLFVCAVPQLDESGTLLKDVFRPTRFLDLLPLLVFLREALGRQAWCSLQPRATFMIDDPNFRFTRYGFLRYRDLIEASKKHAFHASVAMIPLDWKKTSLRVAELIRDNRDHVSIVMHGVDHVFEEFVTKASVAEAESTIAQGLARMAAHQEHTGLRFARAMTFPHGICSVNWMKALRNAGMEGAITDWAQPVDLESEAGDPLYEMHPAEMSFLGFPLINRYPAEDQREALLFQAFLGKPLIMYTHHGFFRQGLDATIELVEFLNHQVKPRWASIDEILRSNYQVRAGRDGVAIRVFSNRIQGQIDAGKEVRLLVKPGLVTTDNELWHVNGAIVSPTIAKSGTGIAFVVPSSSRFDVTFGQRRPIAVPTSPRRPRLKSIGRRLATEVRDQVVHPLLGRPGPPPPPTTILMPLTFLEPAVSTMVTSTPV